MLTSTIWSDSWMGVRFLKAKSSALSSSVSATPTQSRRTKASAEIAAESLQESGQVRS